MSLAGKCAVVYSGARGIGRAYCEHLVKNGCKVYFGDILVDEGSQTAQELQSKYKDSTITFLKCDVLLENDVRELLAKAITACSHVDIVIANTGIVDEKDWEKCMQLNLGSVMRVFYIAMEHMSKTNGGKGGHFIATSSIMGIKPGNNAPVYSATKHAIVGFVRAWGTEFNYQLTNVRCNSINPYFVKTKLMEDLKPEQLYLKEHYQLIMDGSEKLDADDQYISIDEIGSSLISLLQNTTANGQCLIVSKSDTSYAEFSETVM